MGDKEKVRKILKIVSIALAVVLFIGLVVYLAVIGSKKPSFPEVTLAQQEGTTEAGTKETLPPDANVVQSKTVMESGKEYYVDLSRDGKYDVVSVNKRNLEYMPDLATLYINGAQVLQEANVKEIVLENPFNWERGFLIGVAVYDESLPEGYLYYRLYEYHNFEFFPIDRDLECFEMLVGDRIPAIATNDQIVSGTPTFTRNGDLLDTMLYLGMPEIFFAQVSAETVDARSFYLQDPNENQTAFMRYEGKEWPTLKSSRQERVLNSFQAAYAEMDTASNRYILPIGERYQIVKIIFNEGICTKQDVWDGQQTWFQLARPNGTYVYVLAQNLWKDMQIADPAEETSSEDATAETSSEDVTAETSEGDATEENGSSDASGASDGSVESSVEDSEPVSGEAGDTDTDGSMIAPEETDAATGA